MAIDVEIIKDRVNIVDVISGHVDLKRAGKNHHGCCPFHDEKTPSFTVAEDKQFYHCFGCGAHGDVIGFIMDYMGVDFVEAVKKLDSNAFDGIQPNQPIKKIIRIPLALQQERHEDLPDILNGCELVDGIYFSGANQILPLTDLNNKLISLAMIEGKGFDIRFYKKSFTYGSCAILGKLSELSVLTCDYWQALKLRREGLDAICIFEPLNIYFIVNTIRRFGFEPTLICNSLEDFMQAEKMHMYKVFDKEYGNYVITDYYLDKELQ